MGARTLARRSLLKPTGPAAAPFSPNDVPNLALRLDASAITGLADGAAVATWSDTSGNARDASQATVGFRPLYKTAIIGGKPVVRFDGVDDRLELAVERTEIGAYSILVVQRTSGDGVFVAARTVNNQTFRIGHSGGNNLALTTSANTGTSVAMATARTTPTLVEIHRDGVTVNFFESAVQLAVSAELGDPSTVKYANIGCLGSPLALFLNGDIAELLVYERFLTTAERTDLRSFLRAKWSV